MGVHLLRAMYDRIWSMSRGHKGMMTMVCPPLVTPNWDRERAHCQLSLEVISHGSLSRLKPQEDSVIGQLLARAQTLAVDEAHNFLNQTSNRTRQLLHNLADQTVLFTATPINRSASDLLRLVDILGADNFDDAVLAIFERLNRAKGSVRDAHPEEPLQYRRIHNTENRLSIFKKSYRNGRALESLQKVSSPVVRIHHPAERGTGQRMPCFLAPEISIQQIQQARPQ